LHSLRVALAEVVATEDAQLRRRLIAVVAATPSSLKGVLGGIQLKGQAVIAEFFGARLGLPSDALVPTVLAAAAGGVIQATQTRWYVEGGDLPIAFSDGLRCSSEGSAPIRTPGPPPASGRRGDPAVRRSGFAGPDADVTVRVT